MPEIPAAELLIVIGAVFGACLLQSMIGLGAGMLLVPLTLLILPPTQVVILATCMGLALNLMMLGGEGRRPEIGWRPLAPIWIAAPIGQLAGALLLVSLPAETLRLLVALFLVGMALMQLPQLGANSKVFRGEAPGVGIVSGLTSTLAGLNGPPIALHFLRRGLHGHELRDALTISFLCFSVQSLVVLALTISGSDFATGLKIAALALPAIVAGHQIGRHGFHQLSRSQHRHGVIAVAGAGALLVLATTLA